MSLAKNSASHVAIWVILHFVNKILRFPASHLYGQVSKVAKLQSYFASTDHHYILPKFLWRILSIRTYSSAPNTSHPI